jgi:hypothetical protein
MTEYSLALTIVRLVGILYLVVGLTWVVVIFVLMVVGGVLGDLLLSSLFTYAVPYAIGGLVVLLLSRRMASFAAQPSQGRPPTA